MIEREVLKLALEALEIFSDAPDSDVSLRIWEKAKAFETITSLRQALATEESSATQEPFGYVNRDEVVEHMGLVSCGTIYRHPAEGRLALYTHPQPKREWVGLTDEEIDQGLLRSDFALSTAHAWRAGVVFAMTKLKKKNT